jgi:hypothetical protein
MLGPSGLAARESGAPILAILLQWEVLHNWEL